MGIKHLNYLPERTHALIAYRNSKRFEAFSRSRKERYVSFDKILPDVKFKLIKYQDAPGLFPLVTRSRLNLTLNKNCRTDWSWHPIKNSVLFSLEDLNAINYRQLTYFTSRLPVALLQALRLTSDAKEALNALRRSQTLSEAYNIEDDDIDRIQTLLDAPEASESCIKLTTDQKRNLTNFKKALKWWLS